MLNSYQNIKMLTTLTNMLPSSTVVVAPSYRLATVRENTCPANLQDAIVVYYHLLSKGFASEKISLSGDSSGGNLGKSLAQCILSGLN
jgi:acetyl esterase/lipase